MADNATFKIDDREWQRYVRKFGPRELDKLLAKASGAGARAAAKTIKADAPVGTSAPSQFYRANGLGHGTFKRSIKAARIRKVGVQARTVGHVIGPMGKLGFTRAWVEGGTKAHGYKTRAGRHPGARGKHWFEAASRAGSAVATTATQRILDTYAKD